MTNAKIKVETFFGCLHDMSPLLKVNANTLKLKYAVPTSNLLIDITICGCQC